MEINEEKLLEENNKLRSLVEEYRERELDDLRKRLKMAEEKAEHFRNEAQRLSDIGRQIAADYQTQIAELKGKLQGYEQPTRPQLKLNR